MSRVEPVRRFGAHEATQVDHSSFSFRALAVSAPYWPLNTTNRTGAGLNSRTPFSLQNALRGVAAAARRPENVAWNWSNAACLRDSTLLYDCCDDAVCAFREAFLRVDPQIVFIGCMTLSYPGALRLAEEAKLLSRGNTLVVVGGKHINETLQRRDLDISHGPASPALLAVDGRVPSVVDLFISGEAEALLVSLTQKVEEAVRRGHAAIAAIEDLDSLAEAPGRWCLSAVRGTRRFDLVSRGRRLDRETLPVPCELYGIDARFPIFETDLTAHVYSDQGLGCAEACFYCSESRTIAGRLADPHTAASRLFRQILASERVARTYGPDVSISAFVEDSILLAGSIPQLRHLSELLREAGPKVPFGCQFTVDMLNDPRRQASIRELKELGLSYIYVGMETIDESAASRIAKNKRRGSWYEKNLRAIEFVSELGIDYGVATLFGIGENSEGRFAHLELLKDWQETYGNPKVLSLNWAVRHPFFDTSGEYDYIDWGTPQDSPYLELFQDLFGEASVNYGLEAIALPDLSELREFGESFLELTAARDRVVKRQPALVA